MLRCGVVWFGGGVRRVGWRGERKYEETRSHHGIGFGAVLGGFGKRCSCSPRPGPLLPGPLTEFPEMIGSDLALETDRRGVLPPGSEHEDADAAWRTESVNAMV